MLFEYNKKYDSLLAENTDLKTRLKYYENSHSPPSKNSLKWKKQKCDKQKEMGNKESEYEKPGQKKNHVEDSQNTKST